MYTKHRIQSLVCFLLISIFTFPLLSAQDSDWYYGKPIKSISFDGLKTVRASDLDGITSNFVGKEFSDDVIADFLNRIFALNYFEDIDPQAIAGDPEQKSVRIVLVVKEYPVLSQIRFSGNRQIRSPELKEAISLKEREIYDDSKRLVAERAIRDHYIEKGYTEIKVSSSAEQNENGYVVTFKVDEGQQTVVKEILFSGNLVVSSKTLRNKISLKQVGVFNKGSFQEAMVEQDKKTILAYYQDRGYVDVRILSVNIEPSLNEEKNRRELTIQFNLQEGSKYTFGGITITGNHVFSTEELSSLMKLKEGADYKESAFQEGLLAIQTKYADNGYNSNRFASQVKKDTDNKIVSYDLFIEENDRSHIENILIKGNGHTKENVIRREIPIESGDVFSNSKITNGWRNLSNLQYFSSVQPEVTQGSEDGLVDLVFNVEEQSTKSIQFGMTLSGVSNPNEFPISLFLSLQDTNLFGEGKSASTSIVVSTEQQSASISYGQNWIFDKPISSSLTFSVSHANEYDLRNFVLPNGAVDYSNYYMQYEQYEFSLSETLGRRWTPDFAILTLSGGISGSLINNVYDSSVYVSYDSSVSDYNNNFEPKNAVFVQFSMDGRNISYDPSKGWFWSQRVSWYGLLPQGVFGFIPGLENWGEKEFYLRTDTKAEKYFTLFTIPFSETYSLSSILMLYTGLSFQFPIPNTTIKQSNQLYIDGTFYGRGWTLYNTAAGRGKMLLNNTVELRFPFLPNILSLDFFFDASLIKDEPSELFTGFTNKNDWYFSYGPSLRICLQQFPLRFLFVSNFQIDDNGISLRDAYNNQLDNWLSTWHFVLSFNITNR